MLDNKVTQALYDDGIMSALYKAGFISAKVFLYRDIYLWVDLQVRVRDISTTQAVTEATEKFKRHETTIWNALKAFK